MSLATVSLLSAPMLALLGVLVGQRVARSASVELDRWRKREETMRLLQCATELAVDEDAARQSVPVVAAVLDAVARRSIVEETRGRSP